MNPPDTIPEAGIDIIRKHLCLEIDFERWPHAYQSLATVIDTLQKQCEELQSLKAHHDYCRSLLNCPADDVLGESISELKSRALKAEAEVVELKKQSELRLALIKDHCEEEETIKRIARPLLGDFKVDGDSYGVPSSQDICQSLVDQLSQLQQDVKPLLHIMKDQHNTLTAIDRHNHLMPFSCVCGHHVRADIEAYPKAIETFLSKHPELSQ